MSRLFLAALTSLVMVAGAIADEPAKPAAKKVDVGTQAPAFKIKDASAGWCRAVALVPEGHESA